MLNTKKLLQATLLLAYICNGHTADALTLTPTNSRFATDVDHVLLSPNRSQEDMLSWGAAKYLWHSSWSSFLKGWSNFKRINGERKYVEWMEKGLTEPAEFVRSITQQKEIILETLELYQKLHAQGFQFYTATNIGSIFFGDIQKKFSNVFNDTFIKHGMTVDYSVKNPIEKPDPRYFEMLKAKINPDGKYYILFIDDKKENVEAARKAGLLAIQFDNAKQLAEDLKNLYDIIL